MDKKEKKLEPIIAGILLVVYNLYNFINFLRVAHFSFNALTLLLIIANVFLAVVLFLDKKDKLLLAPTGLLALLTVVSSLKSIIFNIKSMVQYPHFEVIISSIFFILLGIVNVLAPIALFLFVLAKLTGKPAKISSISKKYFYIPALLTCVSAVFSHIVNAFFVGQYNMVLALLLNLLSLIINVAVMLLVAAWLEDIVLIKKTERKENNMQKNVSVGTTSDLFIPLVKHILLTFFTFGIWQFIWIYKTTLNLNSAVNGQSRSATKELLLCLFIPFYSIYWIYKTALLVDTFAHQQNKQSDIAKLCLILAIFIPVVPVILIQDKINGIVNNEGDVIASAFDAPAQQPAPAPAPQVDVAEEIKKFKDLLDMGAITQEEFDAKKKELLHL